METTRFKNVIQNPTSLSQELTNTARFSQFELVLNGSLRILRSLIPLIVSL